MQSLLSHPASILCLIVFAVSYAAVFFEDILHLKKSKPVMLGAGIIWIIIAAITISTGGDTNALHHAVSESLQEYAALLLFLLAAMTYINALQERRVFDALRVRMLRAGLNMRQLFWLTGIIAFFLSPIADNLTTALVMGTIVMAVAGSNTKFLVLGCINIVSAANSGGAFSPFGDITTLMVWQANKVEFFEFFALFLPSLVNFLIPAIIMSRFIPAEKSDAAAEPVTIKYGGKAIIALGLFTIVMAVSFEQILHLPAFLGMMMGLALLMMTAWHIRNRAAERGEQFVFFDHLATIEWDTLLFFYGVIFSVGGLAYLGYLELASSALYGGLGASAANILLGGASAVLDNIPIMFAVLQMDPNMDHFQWLLVTLTAGVGGTLLSTGSAAGVGLMGIAPGRYTFLSHLKWTPVLLLGYAASVAVHFLVNG